MALGTPTDGGSAYSAASGTSVAPSYPAGIQANDVLILIVGQKPSTANSGSATTPAGWTLRGSLTAAGGYGTAIGADTGNTNLRFYTKNTVAGTETGTESVTLANNNVSWGLIVRVPRTLADSTFAYTALTGQQQAAPGAALTVTLPSTSAQAGDMFVTAMCIPTDVTTPNQFTNAQTTIAGLTYTNGELEEPDSATGNDIGGFVGYSFVTAGSATNNAFFTATLAGTTTQVRGPVVSLRIRETLPTRTGTMAATETGSDTFAATGDVIVKGSLAATETGSDTFSASGTVTNSAITGSMAATETGSDTFAATGSVIVSGALAATETGPDTFAGSGDVIVRGAFAATETGSDTFAATGDVFVRGSMAATETGDDTFAAAGTVLVEGSLAAAETGDDTFAAAGTVLVEGSLAASESGDDTFAAAGTVGDPTVTGSMAASESGDDTFSASMVVLDYAEANARAYGKKKKRPLDYNTVEPGEQVDWALRMQIAEEDEIVLALVMAAAPLLGAQAWQQ